MGVDPSYGLFSWGTSDSLAPNKTSRFKRLNSLACSRDAKEKQFLFWRRQMLQSFLASDLTFGRGCAPPGLRHKTVVLCRRQGGARPSQPATQNGFADARYALCRLLALCRRLGGACRSPPATQNHGFVSQTQLWTQKLDFDTYAMREALVW